MFDLKIYDNNELTIKFPASNSTATLYHRTPTSAERIEFRSKSFQLLGKNQSEESIKKQLEFQIDYGANFLTGFKEGDFSYDGKPISSDPESENYRMDWRELLEETGSFILEKFVDVVFGYATVEDNTVPFVTK